MLQITLTTLLSFPSYGDYYIIKTILQEVFTVTGIKK